MIDSNWWPENYVASRKQFVTSAESCGAHLETHSIKPTGPHDEALSVDVASFISDNDDHRIILISGVHGVEGFLGASIQINAMHRLKNNALPKRTGVIMIHAANPWGYAHCRRVDENNVDLNRNFIDFDLSRPTSPEQYAILDPVINPQKAPGLSSEIAYWLKASKLIALHRGIEKLARPIAQGQCDYPQGLFFSGQTTSPSGELLQKLILDGSSIGNRTSVLDIHSGLGASGNATLISNTNVVARESRLKWLQSHYQQSVVLDDASDNAYNAQGSLSQWCQRTLNDKRYLYICVEIGTVNPMTLFSALRRENQAHHWSTNRARSYTKTKQSLLNVFAPSSQRWRIKAVAEGLQAFDMTIARDRIVSTLS